MNIFYLNGQFLPENEAKISVLDLGFTRGYGVFSYIRTYNGKPFKLDEHLVGLQNSAGLIGLQIPPISQIKQIVLQVLEKNKLSEAGIKIIITGGESEDGIMPRGKSTIAVIVKPLPDYPKEYYEDGIKVVTILGGRILPEAKITDYSFAILAKKLAKEKDAIEAVYRNEKGENLEGSQTNFFCFIKDVLITADKGIFKGVTRGVVLEIAKKEFKIDLRSIKYDELKNIIEAFITTTTKEIMPVVKIDDIIVGNGKVGSNTKRLMELFKEYTK